MNTNGLHDENHYTSAHDLALIAAAFFIFFFIFSNIHYLKIVESVIEQFHCIRKLIGCFFPEDNADKPHTVSFRTCDKRLTGVIRVTGFSIAEQTQDDHRRSRL